MPKDRALREGLQALRRHQWGPLNANGAHGREPPPQRHLARFGRQRIRKEFNQPYRASTAEALPAIPPIAAVKAYSSVGLAMAHRAGPLSEMAVYLPRRLPVGHVSTFSSGCASLGVNGSICLHVGPLVRERPGETLFCELSDVSVIAASAWMTHSDPANLALGPPQPSTDALLELRALLDALPAHG